MRSRMIPMKAIRLIFRVYWLISWHWTCWRCVNALNSPRSCNSLSSFSFRILRRWFWIHYQRSYHHIYIVGDWVWAKKLGHSFRQKAPLYMSTPNSMPLTWRWRSSYRNLRMSIPMTIRSSSLSYQSWVHVPSNLQVRLIEYWSRIGFCFAEDMVSGV